MRRVGILFALLVGLLPMAALAQTVADGGTTPVRDMSNFVLWGLITGPLTSYAAGMINKLHWPSDVRFGVFFVLALVVAAGNAYFNADLDMHDWLRSALMVVASGVAWYEVNKGAVRALTARTS